LLLLDAKFRFWREPRAWLFAAGFLVPVIPYYLWTQSTPAHVAAFSQAYGTRATTGFFENLKHEFLGRYADFVQFPFRVHIAVLIVAAFVVLWQKNRWLFVRLAILTVPFLVLWIYAFNKNVRYFGVLSPIFALAVTGAALSLREKRWQKFAVVGVLVLYGLSQMAGNYLLLYRDRKADYIALQRELREVIPMGSSAYGAVDFWMALRDRAYYAHERTPFEYAVSTLKPEYLILNDRVMAGGYKHYGDTHAKLRTDCYAFVAQHGELVAKLPYRFYGDLEVYRVTYP
jgi:hypothetical protein